MKQTNISANTIDFQKIVESILSVLTKEEKSELASIDESKLCLLHHSFGQWIRNTYSIWDVHWEPQLENGVDMSPNHPDAISMDIIRMVYKRVSNEHIK